MANDPAPQQIGVDPVVQRNRRNRYAGPATLLDDTELVFQRERSPPTSIDPNCAGRARLYGSLFSVHHLHSGHHLWSRSESGQDGTGRTLTAVRLQSTDIKKIAIEYSLSMDVTGVLFGSLLHAVCLLGCARFGSNFLL